MFTPFMILYKSHVLGHLGVVLAKKKLVKVWWTLTLLPSNWEFEPPNENMIIKSFQHTIRDARPAPRKNRLPCPAPPREKQAPPRRNLQNLRAAAGQS